LTQVNAGLSGPAILPVAVSNSEDPTMAEPAMKTPAKTQTKEVAPANPWRTLENLRNEMERMFEDFRFDLGWSPFRASPGEPIWRREASWNAIPAVDIAEKDGAYEITAELPGMEEKDIEVKYASGAITIKGEKTEEKEEKRKDYHLSERRYGSFQRSFSVPEGVDVDKLAASFKNGVLTITLPKSAEAKKNEKKIPISGA
jgi:HSP20 family protein